MLHLKLEPHVSFKLLLVPFNFTKDIYYTYKDHDRHLYAPDKRGSHANGPRHRYQNQRQQGEKERAGVRDTRCVFYFFTLFYLPNVYLH